MKRNTIQRALVLEAVNSLKCHATADEIYDFIAAEHPSISKGTVYRNLNQLSEIGMIRRVEVPDSACLLYTSDVDKFVGRHSLAGLHVHGHHL